MDIWQVTWTARDSSTDTRTFSEADRPTDPYEDWEGASGEAEAYASTLRYMFRYSEHNPRITITRIA